MKIFILLVILKMCNFKLVIDDLDFVSIWIFLIKEFEVMFLLVKLFFLVRG